MILSLYPYIAYSFPLVMLTLLISLNGCAKDYSLAPPSDSEQITVTVKVSKELKARTLQVMYRSTTCKSKTRGASGQIGERDGFHGIDVELQRKGESDLYEARLATDGGGKCRWHLANVMFGITYSDPARFGENVTWGDGGGRRGDFRP